MEEQKKIKKHEGEGKGGSEQEDLDDYDVTPDFVQNHGILIFYSTETKPWFKITESITYR